MGFLVLALLAADPHSALVIPERLASLDQKGAKVARDIAKEDRVYRKLDPELLKLKAKPDGGPDENLAEWIEQKAVLAQLHTDLDADMADVRALKASKEGVTVDQARAAGDKLDGLEKRVQELRDRLERLTQTLRPGR
jgi:hypothetical protein